MKRLILLFSCLLIYGTAFSKTLPLKSLNDGATYAKEHFPQSGLLKKKASGYWFLKVDNRYISELYPMIKDFLPKGFVIAPYEERTSGVGAHVSIVYENEKPSSSLTQKIGQSYSFEVREFKIVGEDKKNRKQFAVLVIHAPELEKLRSGANLSPLLKGHEFHITIAIKKGGGEL